MARPAEPAKAELITLLRRHPARSIAEVARAIGIPIRTAHRYVTAARATGDLPASERADLPAAKPPPPRRVPAARAPAEAVAGLTPATRTTLIDEATRGLRETVADPNASIAARSRASLALADIGRKLAPDPVEAEAQAPVDLSLLEPRELEVLSMLSRKIRGEVVEVPHIIPRARAAWRLSTAEALTFASMLERA